MSLTYRRTAAAQPHGTNAGSARGACTLRLQTLSEENPCNNHSHHLNKSQIFRKQGTGLNVPNELLILNYHPCSNNS